MERIVPTATYLKNTAHRLNSDKT